MRRQSAFEMAPLEHSLALSSFRRRSAAPASASVDANAPAAQSAGQAAGEPLPKQCRPGASQAEAPQLPSNDPLTLDEVSAAIVAAKLTVCAPAAPHTNRPGAR